MASIREQCPRTHLFLVGEGACRPLLEAQTSTLKLSDVVHFTGYRRDIEDWFALADVIVLPSRWEGMPLVAIEALAAGKAIVATAVDGTPEVVLHGECGFIVPQGDSAQMAAAITRLLREPQLRRKFGEVGRRRALQHFDSALQIERTERLYLDTLHQSTRGRRFTDRRPALSSEATNDSSL